MRIIFFLVRKEFQQIFRDMTMLRIIFVLPLIQLFLLGHVVTTDVRNLPVCLLDLDHSSSSRALMSKILAAGYFVPSGDPASPGDMTALIERGRATLGVIVPVGFNRDLEQHRTTAIQVIMDGADANTARVSMGYLSAIIQHFSLEVVIERVLANPINNPPLKSATLRSVVFYNPDLESSNYMIPGIIAILVTMITSVLTSMSIVREREIGTLEQLMVTPIKPMQLLLGKTIPYTILCLLLTTAVLGLAKLHFHIPICGSLPLFYAFVLLFLITTLGLGLFISTISRTQQQALFFTWFINIFAIIMSNFFIPIHNMPKFVQYLTYLNPVRYFMAIVRDLFLKGSGLETLWPDALALAIAGALIFTVSVLRFHKRLA